MSEVLRKRAREAMVVVGPGPLSKLLPPTRVAENEDKYVGPAPRVGERRSFEIPARIWWTMIGCFGVLLATLLAATSDLEGTFVIVIAALFMAMYFGTANAMLRQGPAQQPSPLDWAGEGMLQTYSGPLAGREVAIQMLTVPVAVAFFGIATLLIRIAAG